MRAGKKKLFPFPISKRASVFFLHARSQTKYIGQRDRRCENIILFYPQKMKIGWVYFLNENVRRPSLTLFRLCVLCCSGSLFNLGKCLKTCYRYKINETCVSSECSSSIVYLFEAGIFKNT